MSTYDSHHREIHTPTTVTRSRMSVLRIGQVLGALVGIVFVVIGALAVARSGIDSSLNEPVVQVLGYSQSAAIGLIELVLGLILLLGSLTVWDRGLAAFAGVLMFVGGLILGSSSQKLLHDLGTDQATGWLIMIGGIVAVVASLLPSFTKETIRKERVAAPVDDGERID